ncbi:hypothetical protein HDA40_005401 [Hamadaea flava]|uniref:PadR family transcriptional regulator n=1 Tax=Hamadaea flava TaxID=1742688 RepID=A0ABV8M096_9ACTN|nr:hypothetical protein [Hamadaea flava]MCP2326894.1 hypothetical protein [Hamadaea flava]
MPNAELKPSIRLALIALLLMPEKEITDPMLYERFRVRVAKAGRDVLGAAGLVEVVRRNAKGEVTKAGGTYFHQLTPEGRRHARALLAEPAPADAKGSVADVRLLYAIGKLLDRVIRDYGLDEERVFHPEDAGEPRPAVPVQQADGVEAEIMAAYANLSRQHGDLVSLVRLRGALSHVDRADLDKALKLLDRRRSIQLEPDPNRKALTPEVRTAALSIGGEDMHFITVGHR